MKLAACTFAALAILATGFDGEPQISVLESNGPILLDNGPAIVKQETVLEKPIIIEQTPQIHTPPATLSSRLLPPQSSHYAPLSVSPEPCCVICSYRPVSRKCVEINMCLVDPLGCEYEACIEVPVCCLNETPCIEWNKRLLGRKVATICWECCDHEVKVIVTRRGKVKVRD